MAKKRVRVAKTGWRNRIVGHAVVPAKNLLANPLNWRCHPDPQQAAMRGVLEEIGWCDEVIVNKTTGFVIDGHMRVGIASSQDLDVPVTYVELTSEEEAKVLAVYDHIGTGATVDTDKLGTLLRSFETDNQAVANLIHELAIDNAIDLNLDMPVVDAARGSGDDVSVPFPPEDEPADQQADDGLSVIGDGGRVGHMNMLRFGVIETPMTEEEVVLLEKAYKLYCEENGTNYGFTHWLLDHVRSRLPD